MEDRKTSYSCLIILTSLSRNRAHHHFLHSSYSSLNVETQRLTVTRKKRIFTAIKIRDSTSLFPLTNSGPVHILSKKISSSSQCTLHTQQTIVRKTPLYLLFPLSSFSPAIPSNIPEIKRMTRTISFCYTLEKLDILSGLQIQQVCISISNVTGYNLRQQWHIYHSQYPKIFGNYSRHEAYHEND